MNSQRIDIFAQGGEKLRRSIDKLTEADLLATPGPGKWSIQQVVLHLLDSDLVAGDRMKRIIAEDNPALLGYDETKFAENLYYNEQPAAEAVAMFDLNRKLLSRILRKLPESAWQRFGTHNQRGKIALGEMLEGYIQHLDHHLKFINDKRERMGKLMW